MSVYVKECLRWCNPVGPNIEDPWPVVMDKRSEAAEIDTFIDRRLHFLPLPRLERKCTKSDQDASFDGFDDVCMSLIGFANACGQEINDVDDDDLQLYTIALKFKELCPTLDTLRHVELPLVNFKCALALLALDPVEYSRIKANTLYYEIFPQLALKMVEKETESPTSLHTLLQDVDAYIQKKDLDEAYSMLPECADWPNKISWLAARDNMMVSVPNLSQYAEISGLSLSTLEKCAFVKNIVDEEIQIGFERRASCHT
jgi:hypothetical protein